MFVSASAVVVGRAVVSGLIPTPPWSFVIVPLSTALNPPPAPPSVCDVSEGVDVFSPPPLGTCL